MTGQGARLTSSWIAGCVPQRAEGSVDGRRERDDVGTQVVGRGQDGGDRSGRRMPDVHLDDGDLRLRGRRHGGQRGPASPLALGGEEHAPPSLDSVLPIPGCHSGVPSLVAWRPPR
jgi:hypothetical protein